MKKLLTMICMLSCMAVFAQEDVKFNASTHQFGKIKQNVPATYSFTFTNTSAKPVVIEMASAECGCTTPEYSKEPTVKGKSNNIKVTYNAAALGAFKKRVTVKFAHLKDPVILTIEGEVIAGK